MKIKWSKEEDEYLSTNYGKKTLKEMCDDLKPRTKAAIILRLSMKGISSKAPNIDGKISGALGELCGYLKIIKLKERITIGKTYGWYVFCKCLCGKEVYILLDRMKNGSAKSCGCLKSETTINRLKTHGMAHTRLYKTYNGMKARCYNPNEAGYSRYGKIGITICEEWLKSFEVFRDWALNNGYDDTLTIERIDYKGSYCPENCKWATMTEQANNKSNNRLEKAFGETKTVANWAKDYRCKVSLGTLQGRMDKGWKIEESLTTEIKFKLKLTEEEKVMRGRARWVIAGAIRRGTLVRPDTCQHKGCDLPPQAHHYMGYSKEHQRDVVWLCSQHHSDAEYLSL